MPSKTFRPNCDVGASTLIFASLTLRISPLNQILLFATSYFIRLFSFLIRQMRQSDNFSFFSLCSFFVIHRLIGFIFINLLVLKCFKYRLQANLDVNQEAILIEQVYILIVVCNLLIPTNIIAALDLSQAGQPSLNFKSFLISLIESFK